MKNEALEMFKNTIKKNGDSIYIKPFCDYFEINYENQCRIVKGDNILKRESTKKSNVLLFGDNRLRILLTEKGFIRWIQLINPRIVQVTLQQKLEDYQTLIFDYMYGSKESEEQVMIDYARLRKLKHLYAKIGREIQNMDNKVKYYLDNKFQYKIDLE